MAYACGDLHNERIAAMSQLSTFLFASPSFLEGIARILDVGGTLQEYNRSPSGDEADCKAIAADWLAIGEDLQASIQKETNGVEKLKKIQKK